MGNGTSKKGKNQPPIGRRKQRSNDSENRLSSHTKQGKLPSVWYRLSGHANTDEIPLYPECKSVDERKIKTDVRERHITHMCIDNGVVPALDVLSPHLTHLRISGLTNQSDLQVLSSLTQLRKLDLSHNNFSEGCPAIVSHLRSLEVLSFYNCQLKDLPHSLRSLTQLKELDLAHNNLSEGCPAVVSQLSSLELLSLLRCHLKDLPQSLSSLTRLKRLYLSDNDFSGGCPAVLSSLCSLEVLLMSYCQLKDLPQKLVSLTLVKNLYVSGNDFEQLPSVIYSMSNLERLDFDRSSKLTRIDKKISQLSNLNRIECDGSESLQFPPYAVCVQGISAIRKYFADFEAEQGVELLEVPVAVVGMLRSGKSSLIKSLIAGERKLTYREDGSPLDEATRVFRLQDLSLQDSRVRFIDYGGHEVYHMAYQLVINERCLPLLVVNLEEFHQLSCSRGAKEATRRVCIDWLSHLYLACPRLGSPVLALTHADMLADEVVRKRREELMSMSEIIRNELLMEDRLCLGTQANNSNHILHLANRQRPLFAAEDIFEFSNDVTEKSNIENMRINLNIRCKSFSLIIPRLWEKVEKFVGEHREKPYVTLSEVMNEFPTDDPITIVRYMHNTGKVFWFESIEGLAPYIFHDIAAITDMISLLLNHSSDEMWSERVNKFVPFTHNQRTIGTEKYSSLVQRFTTTGIIDQVLLDHLLKFDSEFPVEIAKELLKSFHILHGPIEGENGSTYILPYFAEALVDDSWRTEGPIPLRLDIVFGGLSIPQYVYQLMTVVVLNRTHSVLSNVRVKRNGVSIYHGDCRTHLIHDCGERKVTLQVSSTISQLGHSWKHLIETAKDIKELLSRVWKASHAEILVYCAQCLITGVSHPDRDVEPDWFYTIDRDYDLNKMRTVTTISPLEKVVCSSKDLEPSVPRPLRFPCNQLSTDDIQTLHKHICAIQQEQGETTLPNYGEDTDGDLSDVETEGYCDISTKDNIYISMRPKSVTDQRIKELYRNSEKVYPMSDKVRGRALIINNKEYSQTAESRTGSGVDYDNISKLFKALDFVIAKSQQELSDLTQQEIYKEIAEETKRKEHEKYGMFVLVIMSHGKRGGLLLDRNGQSVDLLNIQDLLSSGNFPAMTGKPKLLIVQACSGVRRDHGDPRDLILAQSGAVTSVPTNQSGATSSDSPDQSSAATIGPTHQSAAATEELVSFFKPIIGTPEALNVDDFYIMKASSESYLATRTTTHGSWFIRVLVCTFYNHCNHRDIESLFKIIQARVRQVSLAADNVRRFGYQGGNVPTAICTFTKLRKLYLFPGYHLRRA